MKAFSLLRLCMSLVNPEFCSKARQEFNERYNILKRMYMPKNTIESKSKIPSLSENFNASSFMTSKFKTQLIKLGTTIKGGNGGPTG